MTEAEVEPKRRAYGYKSFTNYRLRLLNACAASPSRHLSSAMMLICCGVERPSSTPSAPTEAVAVVDAGARFKSDTLGIAFDPGPFSTKEGSGFVDLDGDFWVDEPHGLGEPGQESKQYFRGRISVVPKDIRAAVKESTPHFESLVYPKGRFAPPKGLTEPRTLAGRSGFVVLSGAHGYNGRDYFVSIGTDHTLVARFSVVGDFVQTRKKGSPEKEQIRAIESVVASIALTR